MCSIQAKLSVSVDLSIPLGSSKNELLQNLHDGLGHPSTVQSRWSLSPSSSSMTLGRAIEKCGRRPPGIPRGFSFSYPRSVLWDHIAPSSIASGLSGGEADLDFAVQKKRCHSLVSQFNTHDKTYNNLNILDCSLCKPLTFHSQVGRAFTAAGRILGDDTVKARVTGPGTANDEFSITIRVGSHVYSSGVCHIHAILLPKITTTKIQLNCINYNKMIAQILFHKRYHLKCGMGLPLARQVNTTSSPEVTEMSCRGVMNLGERSNSGLASRSVPSTLR